MHRVQLLTAALGKRQDLVLTPGAISSEPQKRPLYGYAEKILGRRFGGRNEWGCYLPAVHEEELDAGVVVIEPLGVADAGPKSRREVVDV